MKEDITLSIGDTFINTQGNLTEIIDLAPVVYLKSITGTKWSLGAHVVRQYILNGTYKSYTPADSKVINYFVGDILKYKLSDNIYEIISKDKVNGNNRYKLKHLKDNVSFWYSYGELQCGFIVINTYNTGDKLKRIKSGLVFEIINKEDTCSYRVKREHDNFTFVYSIEQLQQYFIKINNSNTETNETNRIPTAIQASERGICYKPPSCNGQIASSSRLVGNTAKDSRNRTEISSVKISFNIVSC